ncbi:hypothetical protein K438DRAFT_1764689 [Mycena galopus ATCC 62051]|nr:hypothetical protein K438DRAFT_1764689 [Mycena galopus ATCC 62051]
MWVPVHRPMCMWAANCARHIHNLPVLALLAPPALDSLHVTLSDSDPAAETLHACLRAAGPGLRALALCFSRALHIGRPSRPLVTGLRTLHISAIDFAVWSNGPVPCRTPALLSSAAHLLEHVLTTPHLEELVIETEVLDADEIGAGHRAEPDRVLATIPTLRTIPHVFSCSSHNETPFRFLDFDGSISGKEHGHVAGEFLEQRTPPTPALRILSFRRLLKQEAEKAKESKVTLKRGNALELRAVKIAL